MGQGSAAISPQGRDVQRQLNAASCSKIQNEGRRMVADLHPDRGGNPEDFSEAFKRLQKRRNACGQGRQRGDTNSKPKPQRRPGESAKKARQRARRAKQARMQEEQAKARERARTQRQQEADARAGRRQQQQQENTESTGTSYMRDIGVGAAAVGAAGLVAREMGRGRPRVRNTRIVTRNDGSRVLVRNDGSIIRELTPERR